MSSSPRQASTAPALARRLPALSALLLALLVAALAVAPLAAQPTLPIPGVQPPADPPPAEDPAQESIEDGTEETGNRLLDLPPDPLSAGAWQLYGRQLLDASLEFVPNLLRALFVLLVFWLGFRIAAGIVRGVLARRHADASIVGISTRLLKYVVFAFALVMALGELGFNVASLIAGLGILGLAVGLAAQESLGNVVAGLTILWDRPYRVGDNVTIAGTFGRVQEIGLRTTRVLTVERLDAILPNREVVKETILNHTNNPQLRLAVPVSIAYKEDTREARRVLLAAVAGHRLIREEPAPTMTVMELADSGVNVELRVWLRDPHEEREALCELIELAKLALDEAGIVIPFPQRTLHFAAGSPGRLDPSAESEAG